MGDFNNTSQMPSDVFNGKRAMTTQSYTEANVKNGSQFTLTIELTLLAFATEYVSFTTPDDGIDTLIKTRLISTDGGMRYTPLLGGTWVNANDLIGTYNLRGDSPNVSHVVVDNVTSVSDPGAGFDVIRSTSGQGSSRSSGIFSGDGIDRVLRQDTPYLLQFENLENREIFIVYSLTWYEGSLDLPLPPGVL